LGGIVEKNGKKNIIQIVTTLDIFVPRSNAQRSANTVSLELLPPWTISYLPMIVAA